jgi:hypothetical protein
MARGFAQRHDGVQDGLRVMGLRDEFVIAIGA